MPADPVEVAGRAAQAAAHHAEDMALAAAGVGAVLLRVAAYTGPPRPWRAVVADAVMQVGVALAVCAVALWATGSAYAAAGLGTFTGVIGWEVVKGLAVRRLQREVRR